MIVADLKQIAGRRYPAARTTQKLGGSVSPIQAQHFCIGNVTLDADGGQVPWHNHDQEEVYFVLEGQAEMCLGEERRVLSRGRPCKSLAGVSPVDHIEKLRAYAVLLWPGRDVAPLAAGTGCTLPRAGVEARAA